MLKTPPLSVPSTPPSSLSPLRVWPPPPPPPPPPPAGAVLCICRRSEAGTSQPQLELQAKWAGRRTTAEIGFSTVTASGGLGSGACFSRRLRRISSGVMPGAGWPGVPAERCLAGGCGSGADSVGSKSRWERRGPAPGRRPLLGRLSLWFQHTPQRCVGSW